MWRKNWMLSASTRNSNFWPTATSSISTSRLSSSLKCMHFSSNLLNIKNHEPLLLESEHFENWISINSCTKIRIPTSSNFMFHMIFYLVSPLKIAFFLFFIIFLFELLSVSVGNDGWTRARVRRRRQLFCAQNDCRRHHRVHSQLRQQINPNQTNEIEKLRYIIILLKLFL